MSQMSSLDHEEIIRRIGLDLADAYDEEFEIEVEDHAPGVDGRRVPGGRRGIECVPPALFPRAL
jgi:hypothetical protein